MLFTEPLVAGTRVALGAVAVAPPKRRRIWVARADLSRQRLP